MSRNDTAPVHSGNYYTTGVKRVIRKLGEMNVAIPADALKVPPHTGFGEPLATFTRLEHAMLDWFEGRDYDQAQALIHFKSPRNEWQVIRLLDGDKAPRGLSSDMLCPTRLDALGAIIDACDRDTLSIDSCRHDGDALIVVIHGIDVARIQPVKLEPFDIGIRDRVRTAFKGVRYGHEHTILTHAARLPGFKVFAHDGEAPGQSPRSDACMLLGFPTNWACAMRAALKQVGIVVKQNQAQEIAAVFFGASDWHQLTKHQGEINDQMAPVTLAVDDPGGRQIRFYHTTEEALFAMGKQLEASSEPVVLQEFSLCLDKQHVLCWVAKEGDFLSKPPGERYLVNSWLATANNDYWSIQDYADDGIADAAKRLLEAVEGSEAETTTLGILYDKAGDAGLLEATLGRSGIPPNQIVNVGEHVLAVSYVPEPDGGPKMAARLHIFRITPDGPRKLEDGDISMYKAVTTVTHGADGIKLQIRPDYGKNPAIEIPVAHMGQVEQLKALTHPKGIFTYSPFNLGEAMKQGAIH